MRIRVIVERGDLQLAVDSEPLGEGVCAGIHFIFKILFLVEVKVSICEQKSAHTDLTRIQVGTLSPA
jgi:hypothetical protein